MEVVHRTASFIIFELMLEGFLNNITRENLFMSGDKILLAVSGGMDSVAMVELFRRAGFNFGIAHCNFTLRGAEADADEAFVQSLAEKLKVPFYVKRFATQIHAREHGLSIQMAARELRYNWFEEIRTTCDYVYVATAHHGDDQIETFFINLLRVTGLSGLHGILPKQGAIIHPLLYTFRKEIEKFVRENNLYYRTDASNASDKYLRNRIRHQIIPVLGKINPLYQKSITGTIERIREAERIFRAAINARLEPILKKNQEAITVSIPELITLDPLDSYLFELLSPFGFNDATIAQIKNSFGSLPGKQFLSPTHRLIKDREHLIIVNKESSLHRSADQLFFESGISCLDDPFHLKFTVVEDVDHYSIPDSPGIASLDYDKLSFPLLLRRWQQGDYFYPLGLEKKKKLSDFFIDEKLSLVEKENAWLLISNEDIVWVVGKRIDHRYRKTDRTELIYKIVLIR
jgi:tRNA(Ile)-lysidine synthase